MRSCRLKILATAAVFAGAVAFAGVPPALATDPVPSEFEINDNEDFGPGPPFADIASDGCSMDEPDWDDIFTDSGGADPQGLDTTNRGGLRDDTDGDCFASGNGIPDFDDVWGGIAATFVNDDTALKGFVDDTTFAESNKNNDLINTWNWKTGNVPPKDDIFNAYVYGTISDPSGDLMFYVGIERLAQEGDSHLDVEFNQAAIGLDKDVPCGDDESAGPADSKPCEFTGDKTDGDILVVMDFERGGDLGFVEVRVWDDTIDEYVLVGLPLGGEGCVGPDGLAGNNGVCAFNNSIGIPSGDWLTIDRKLDTITTIPRNGFTEIGVNVTQVIEEAGGVVGCFSTVQVKSRSSQSFNSELKDFALAGFGICEIEVTKDGPDLSKVGDDITYDFTITNTGGLTLFLQSVDDDVIGDLSGDAPAACDELAADESCAFSVDYTVQGGDPDPLNNIVTAIYNNISDGSGTDVEDDDDHTVNLFQPDVTVTKTGDELSKIGDMVDYDFTVENTGSADSPDLILDIITDNKIDDAALLAALQGAGCDTLVAGAGTCAFSINDFTIPGGASDPFENTVEVHYHPDGFTNDIDDTDSHSVNLFVPSLTVAAVCFGDARDDKVVTTGEQLTLEVVITNTSSGDTPDMLLISFAGEGRGGANAAPFNLAGALAAGCGTLTSCTITDTFNTIPSDEGTINVGANVVYSPDGFSNQIPGNDSDSCTVVPPADGSLVIRKFTVNGVGGPFDYTQGTGDGGSGGNVLPATLELTTTADVGCNEQTSHTALCNPSQIIHTITINTVGDSPRTFTIEEDLLTLPGDFNFVDWSCVDEAVLANLQGDQEDPGTGIDGDSSEAGAVATAVVSSGETVVCTSVNERPGASCSPGIFQGQSGLWDDACLVNDGLADAVPNFKTCDDFQAGGFGSDIVDPTNQCGLAGVTLLDGFGSPKDQTSLSLNTKQGNLFNQMLFKGLASLLTADIVGGTPAFFADVSTIKDMIVAACVDLGNGGSNQVAKDNLALFNIWTGEPEGTSCPAAGF